MRTGQAAFNQVHGMGTFDYYHQHAEAAACFNAAMTSLSGHEVAAILAAYDFTGMATMIDVGGGQGHCSLPSCRPIPQRVASCLTSLPWWRVRSRSWQPQASQSAVPAWPVTSSRRCRAVVMPTFSSA